MKRVKQQESQAQIYSMRLQECSDDIDKLFTRHQVHTSVTLQELKRQHIILCHRVLKVLTQVHVLRNAGYPIRQQEEILGAKLQQLMQELSKTTRVKLIELQAKANQLIHETPGFTVNDQRQLELIESALIQAQSGLQILSETVAKDTKQVKDITKVYKERLNK